MQTFKELSIPYGDVAKAASQCGLTIFSVTSAEPLYEEVNRLERWQRNGFAADMSYMQRPADLFGNPDKFLPGAKSLVTVSVRYEQRQHAPLVRGRGRVARYAWGTDYHLVLKQKLEAFAQTLIKVTQAPLSVRTFTDAVPLLERAFARRSGMGFIGKNSLLIIPKRGSLFFLGELILNASITNAPLPLLNDGSCGSCTQCKTNCPTNAIVDDFTIDARRCISYLTIEKKGALEIDERRMLGEWLFGCDVCQDVCPFNHRTIKEGNGPELSEFEREKGAGDQIDLSEVLKIRKNSDFKKRFNNSPLLRPKREGLLRNAAAVAANTNAVEVGDALMMAFNEDSSPVVRSHALWSICELYRSCSIISKDKLTAILQKGLKDVDSSVQLEARRSLEEDYETN